MELRNEITCMFPLPYQEDEYPAVVFRANVVDDPVHFVITSNRELLRRTDQGTEPYRYTGELPVYATVYYQSGTRRYLGTSPTIRHGDYRMIACVDGKWVPAYLTEIGFMLIFKDGKLVNYRIKN